MSFQLTTQFDPRTIDPAQFPSVPLGDYRCVISDSEIKANSANDGGYIDMSIKIIEGQFANIIVSDKLNIFNKSDIAVKIAEKRLSAYCHVTGNVQGPLQNTGQLHNIPFIATIGPQKGNENYTSVLVVKDANGQLPGKSAANPVAAAVPTNTAPVQQQFAPPAAQPAAQPAWGPPATFVPPVATAPAAAAPWQQTAPAANPYAAPASAPPPANAPWIQQPAAAAPAKAPWEK